MADYGAMGRGQAYQEIVVAGQRYGAMTRDAFDPIAASSPRAVGPRPISTVSNPYALDEQSTELGGASMWNPVHSFVPWIIAALVIGLLWLHIIHF